jgi:biopolymer transport protein ExbD
LPERKRPSGEIRFDATSHKLSFSMPLKTESMEEPILNLTPMIDIVFLLIIFFMVGTQFTEIERQFDVQLPQVADATPLTSRPDEMVINVQADGTITMEGQEKTLDEVFENLTAAKEAYPDQGVLIRGDGTGPYQFVVDVLAVANRAAMSKVSLAYKQQPKQQIRP